jgi:hypothetical protein
MKKTFLLCLLAGLSQTACAEGSVWDKPTPALLAPKEMTVFRSPSCGCCEKWMAHMQKQGFTIKDAPSDDMPAIKQQFGIPQPLQSCHTALVDGYVVEGHVPAADVKKLLKAKTPAAGLTAPGMPVDSPGMEASGAIGNFKVILFDKQGNADTFKDYSKQSQ